MQNRFIWKAAAVVLVSILSPVMVKAEPAVVTIDVGQPQAKISPDLWGIFFEEINHAGDGGLYAELVRNRSFEDGQLPEGTVLKEGRAVTPKGFAVPWGTFDPMPGWSLVTGGDGAGTIALDTAKPLNSANPHALRLNVTRVGSGRVGVANSGYWGMAVAKEAEYEMSLYARSDGTLSKPLVVTLESPSGEVLAKAEIDGVGPDWSRRQCTLRAEKTANNARLVITTTAPGTLWLDVASLMPKQTWKGRPNGLRLDLAEMLAGMKPSFVRFPGGCYVEGIMPENAFHWKQTIGDIAQRPGHWCLWGYRSTDGLGYHEYLQMCEDLGAAGMFVANCGMACQGRGAACVPMVQLQPWIQDALDAIEYANGPAESKWGALRVKHGHPRPFHVKYLEIGNENSGPLYEERYAAFYDAIKARYPEIKLIANAPVKSRPMEILDEHYYSTPEFFLANARHYDHYDRKGPRIYVGEFACTQGCGKGNLRAALGEAAFMCGMERNSDVVVMGSYAPLFINVNDRTWNPDMIGFDGARCYGIPSYHVHTLFSRHRGDVVLPCSVRGVDNTPAAAVLAGSIGLSTWHTQAEFKDIKVTSGDKVLYQSDFAGQSKPWQPVRGDWKVEAGAFRQTADGDDLRAVLPGKSWGDCTYTLKARKLGGSEGFLIMFRVRGENDWLWWNIGGWGNVGHAIEKCQEGKSILGSQVPGKVETGRWYDVKIELSGPRIRCYLDGRLIHDVEDTIPTPFHAVASRASASGEVILKVVNFSGQTQEATLELRGAGKVDPNGTAIVLTSKHPDDENSLAEPAKVVPVRQSFGNVGPNFRYTFAPYSLTILRMTVE